MLSNAFTSLEASNGRSMLSAMFDRLMHVSTECMGFSVFLVKRKREEKTRLAFQPTSSLALHRMPSTYKVN